MTGFETKNKYSILNEKKENIFFAYEESSTFLRFFLKKLRPLTLHIIDKDKKEVLRIEKKFAFLLPKAKILKGEKLIANVHSKFKVFGWKYELVHESKTYLCESTFSSPWTFNITKDEKNIALVKKNWSGLGKEMFTDADNFTIDLKDIQGNSLKESILGLAFLIDLNAFERH